jgi:hypothetical protein
MSGIGCMSLNATLPDTYSVSRCYFMLHCDIRRSLVDGVAPLMRPQAFPGTRSTKPACRVQRKCPAFSPQE